MRVNSVGSCANSTKLNRTWGACLPATTRGNSGQAALESFIVILFVCIIFFGILQAAVVFTGDEILHHAAARAARARSVGFNDWMAAKAMHVASIPNSGRMIEPVFQPLQNTAPFGANPSAGVAWDRAFTANPGVSERTVFERVRIPAYLVSANGARASYVLNYEEWERGSFSYNERGSVFGNGTIRMLVEQDFPLKMPLNRFLFPFTRRDEFGDGRMRLSGESESGEHARLYLEP